MSTHQTTTLLASSSYAPPLELPSQPNTLTTLASQTLAPPLASSDTISSEMLFSALPLAHSACLATGQQTIASTEAFFMLMQEQLQQLMAENQRLNALLIASEAQRRELELLHEAESKILREQAHDAEQAVQSMREQLTNEREQHHATLHTMQATHELAKQQLQEANKQEVAALKQQSAAELVQCKQKLCEHLQWLIRRLNDSKTMFCGPKIVTVCGKPDRQSPDGLTSPLGTNTQRLTDYSDGYKYSWSQQAGQITGSLQQLIDQLKK